MAPFVNHDRRLFETCSFRLQMCLATLWSTGNNVLWKHEGNMKEMPYFVGSPKLVITGETGDCKDSSHW